MWPRTIARHVLRAGALVAATYQTRAHNLDYVPRHIIEDDGPRRAPEAPKRALVELRPRLRTRPPRQQPHGFARVREGQDKEPRPSVFPRLRMPDHRPLAVVDLRLLA